MFHYRGVHGAFPETWPRAPSVKGHLRTGFESGMVQDWRPRPRNSEHDEHAEHNELPAILSIHHPILCIFCVFSILTQALLITQDFFSCLLWWPPDGRRQRVVMCCCKQSGPGEQSVVWFTVSAGGKSGGFSENPLGLEVQGRAPSFCCLSSVSEIHLAGFEEA